MQHESTYLIPPVLKNGNGHRNPDELDLIHLFGRAFSFINTFKFLLLGSLIIGLSAGLYFYINSPKQYSTRLIVHPGFISNQDEIEIIENWKNLLSKGEKDRLAGIMNCSEPVIKKLSRISADEILKTYVPNNPNGFLINVTVTDTAVLDELQNGIIYGLNNSPYIKEKLAVRRARDIQLIEKVNQEITKLNSTKTLIDSMIRTRASNSSSLLVDISRINSEWIDLNEKLLGYQEDLKFLSGVQVMENFSKGKMIRPGLLKLPVLGMAAGLFIGYLISLFIYVLRKIKASKIYLVPPQ